jgi:hypothetical protein
MLFSASDCAAHFSTMRVFAAAAVCAVASAAIAADRVNTLPCVVADRLTSPCADCRVPALVDACSLPPSLPQRLRRPAVGLVQRLCVH